MISTLIECITDFTSPLIKQEWYKLNCACGNYEGAGVEASTWVSNYNHDVIRSLFVVYKTTPN